MRSIKDRKLADELAYGRTFRLRGITENGLRAIAELADEEPSIEQAELVMMQYVDEATIDYTVQSEAFHRKILAVSDKLMQSGQARTLMRLGRLRKSKEEIKQMVIEQLIGKMTVYAVLDSIVKNLKKEHNATLYDVEIIVFDEGEERPSIKKQ
jgi:hypothetical protein